jgi:hypothetical protein
VPVIHSPTYWSPPEETAAENPLQCLLVKADEAFAGGAMRLWALNTLDLIICTI